MVSLALVHPARHGRMVVTIAVAQLFGCDIPMLKYVVYYRPGTPGRNAAEQLQELWREILFCHTAL